MITAELLSQLTTALAEGNARRPGVAQALREAYPGISFSVCDDNDIPSRVTPLAQGEGFALYGLGSNGHCATLTNSLEAARGLVIALIDDDD